MNANTILLKAAAHMRKHGFCRGDLVNHQGNVCMLGAISSVPGNASAKDKARIRLRQYIDRLEGFPGMGIGAYNDSPIRVKDGTEAICLMLEAARYKP